ncbi:PQQ-dependent dehydrogenase, methanol/ethanol family [Zavarzinia sp. CC-PAN008]|uniref:PQQ-dependent dehydrogenase, methanol/ethanol family n=1 Tax=Zavarzinia sp. CC-PAN008 TaxID=3243332 RepID=UPI003F746B64
MAGWTRAALAAALVLGVGHGAYADDAARLGKAAEIDGARIQNAESEPGNWLAHGRTYSEQRYSPLDQINDKNVGELGLGWYFDTHTDRGLEASPIVVDGIMFASGSWSVVFALDAKTGKQLWKYDPEVPGEWARRACCDVVNRGVAVYDGRVYVGTIDGRLVALDAKTGQPAWEINTIDRERPYTITGAPRIVNGKVIIGNGGAELGVRGYVSAYDAKTGEMAWRFYTVPGDPSKPFENPELEAAAKTWSGGKWWEVGGGGTVWDSMSYDPELNLLYVGTGNGSPWSRELRSPGGGDNLYLSSILALNPDTGRLVWYYQTTPGDTWDYTATQHLMLADLQINGETRKVIMQAPKNGFFYVLDRETGKLISADKYVHVTWASHVDLATGRPVETEEGSRWANKPELVFPSPYGGHNWQPMAFSPKTGFVYIPAMEIPFVFGPDPNYQYRPGAWNLGTPLSTEPVANPEPGPELVGKVIAWDPVSKREAWSVKSWGPWNGGLLATAGNLIFQGTGDGKVRALNATTGEILWQAPAQTGVIAPPVTYTIDGVQQVSILAGWGGAFGLAAGAAAKAAQVKSVGRILTFTLGGKETLPPTEIAALQPELPEGETPADQVRKGHALFGQFCSACHGADAVAGGVIPDLRYSSAAIHASWQDIVMGGILKDRGMASFADLIKAEDADAIHAYVIWRGRQNSDVSGPLPTN